MKLQVRAYLGMYLFDSCNLATTVDSCACVINIYFGLELWKL